MWVPHFQSLLNHLNFFYSSYVFSISIVNYRYYWGGRLSSEFLSTKCQSIHILYICTDFVTQCHTGRAHTHTSPSFSKAMCQLCILRGKKILSTFLAQCAGIIWPQSVTQFSGKVLSVGIYDRLRCTRLTITWKLPDSAKVLTARSTMSWPAFKHLRNAGTQWSLLKESYQQP